MTNFRVILLCIFAATTFKFFNSLNGDYSTTLNYPVEFVYDQQQYIALNDLPDKVQLNVNGMGWNLFRNSLGIKVTPVQIPLEKPTELKKIPGALIPGFISEQLSEFELNYVLTDTLYVDLDYRKSRLFNIKIDSASITLEDGFKIVGAINCSPDTVRLSGPQSLMALMPDTIMVNLPEGNIDGDYDDEVVINIRNAELIKRNPPTISVTFDAREYTNVRQEIPIDIVRFPLDSSYITDFTMASVNYEVEADKESDINPSQFKVVLDYRKMDLKDSTITPILVNYPDGLLNVQLDTARARVFANE